MIRKKLLISKNHVHVILNYVLLLLLFFKYYFLLKIQRFEFNLIGEYQLILCVLYYNYKLFSFVNVKFKVKYIYFLLI